MKPQRHPFIGLAVVVVGAAFCPSAAAEQPAGEPNEIRWDLAERFEFVWESVEASARIIRHREPAATPDDIIGQRLGEPVSPVGECVAISGEVIKPLVSEDANSPTRERSISVLGKIHILDANDLVGMDVSDPCVFQVVDGDGNDVYWQPSFSYHTRQYQELDYISGTTVDLQTGALVPVRRLQPYDASVSFCLDPNQPHVTSLSSLEWYVYALYAEDLITLEVPFEVSTEWVDVSSGFQIRVEKAGLECDSYVYRTEVRQKSGVVQGLNDTLGFGETVADYLVVETRLLDADGELLPRNIPDPDEPFWSDWVRGTVVGTASCQGELTCPACTNVASIRHVIAVHPSETKIPFVLTHISVPTLDPTAGIPDDQK